MADLPFTAWGAADWKNYDAANGDYTGACLPFGMTRSFNTQEPMQIMQSETYVAFLFEQNSWFNVIPIDGRPASGRYPNVVRRLGGPLGRRHAGHRHRELQRQERLDAVGHPHSNQLHLAQRFSRPDRGHLSYEVTVDDPKTFTKPWKNTRTFTLRPDWEIMEYSCEETTRAAGKAASRSRSTLSRDPAARRMRGDHDAVPAVR